MVMSLRHWNKSSQLPEINSTVVYFWQSGNQKTSLCPIESESRNTHATSVLTNDNLGFILGDPRTFLWSALFFPVCLIRFWQSRGYQRKTFRHVFDSHLLTYGMYLRFRWWFEKTKPAALVVSNDHSHVPCVMVEAAKASGVPTLYVQHACVTERFPPLVADYALLDGLDAKEKYLAIGKTDCEIHLIGPTRLDGYTEHINHEQTVESVGVCFSLADEESRIFELLDMIVKLEGIHFTVRPHYGMSKDIRDRIKSFADENEFEFSDHKSVPALEFMKSIDLLVAGVSAITMEAALLNLTLANFCLNTSERDWYGFVKNELVESFDNTSDLRRFILKNLEQRATSRQLAKRYASSVDEPHDGNSAALAAKIVNSVAFGRMQPQSSLTDSGSDTDFGSELNLV
jgi:hypothetical protein